MPDNIIRLYAAVENNDVRKLERLLSSGANPNEIYFGKTLLLMAVIHGYLEVVKVLLEYNAAPNRVSTDRVTILCNMVYKNNLEMINILLAHPKINTAIARATSMIPTTL